MRLFCSVAAYQISFFACWFKCFFFFKPFYILGSFIKNNALFIQEIPERTHTLTFTPGSCPVQPLSSSTGTAGREGSLLKGTSAVVMSLSLSLPSFIRPGTGFQSWDVTCLVFLFKFSFNRASQAQVFLLTLKPLK